MAGQALVRLPKDGMIAGVCAGLARWLNWDVTAVRVAFAVLSICSVGFPGIVIYVVMWLVMPVEN